MNWRKSLQTLTRLLVRVLEATLAWVLLALCVALLALEATLAGLGFLGFLGRVLNDLQWWARVGSCLGTAARLDFAGVAGLHPARLGLLVTRCGVTAPLRPGPAVRVPATPAGGSRPVTVSAT